jgi:hypothetical protein
VSDLATLADAADSLTNPIRVREPIYKWDDNRNRKIVRYHDHTLPSLLDQLATAIIPGEVYTEDDGGHVRSTPRSVPPARLDAINALILIEAGAARWVNRVGLTSRDRADRNIRALVGAQIDSDTGHEILVDLRRWYGWAATLTGWERPAWKPNAPCPICEERGLRVRLDRSTAACVACGEGWDPNNIGLLAEHVRQIADAGEASRKWANWPTRNQEEPRRTGALPAKESTG